MNQPPTIPTETEAFSGPQRNQVMMTHPLLALFEQTSAEAQAAGLTQNEIDAELAAYNQQRRG